MKEMNGNLSVLGGAIVMYLVLKISAVSVYSVHLYTNWRKYSKPSMASWSIRHHHSCGNPVFNHWTRVQLFTGSPSYSHINIYVLL